MNEHHRVELLCPRPKTLERIVSQLSVARKRSDLDSPEAELVDRLGEFGDGELWMLQRHRADPEPARMLLDQSGHAFVGEPREPSCECRVRPVVVGGIGLTTWTSTPAWSIAASRCAGLVRRPDL